MPATPKNLQYDGWLELTGCNGSTRPLAIPRTQVHRAINCTFRGDEPGPRPGFQFRRLTFADDVDRDLFNGGRWQGAMVYQPINGRAFHLVSKGGRMWKVDPFSGFSVRDISIQVPHVLANLFVVPPIGDPVTIELSDVLYLTPGQTVRIQGAAYVIVSVDSTTNEIVATNVNDTAVNHAAGTVLFSNDLNAGSLFKSWMIQAEKWAVIQDGSSRAIIFDGFSCRRAANNEIPIGTAMAYGRGRIWVASPDGQGFAAGDLIYGPSGTPLELYRDAVLKFTENAWLAGGGWFKVPMNAGDIRAMAFIANLDITLGQGPLQVFTAKGSFSVKVPENRLEWSFYGYDADGSLGASSIDPIQTVSLINRGSESDLSLVAINSDFFFRSEDGIRTFQHSRREFGAWGNTPVSKEMDWVMNLDQKGLLRFSSAVLFDRRYICTCAPQIEERGVVHRGLVALDFAQNVWTENRPPDWDGLWTVSYAYQILSGRHDDRDRCFYYTRNQNGEVELFELDENLRHDQADATQPTRIRWTLETSEITFPNQSYEGHFTLKRLFGAELRVSDMEGDVEFKLRWKPDSHPCWNVWAWWDECAPVGADCDPVFSTCRDWSNALPQIRSAMGIPQPPDICDDNGQQMRTFYTIQVRLDIRGYCKVGALRISANDVDQPVIAKLVACRDA